MGNSTSRLNDDFARTLVSGTWVNFGNGLEALENNPHHKGKSRVAIVNEFRHPKYEGDSALHLAVRCNDGENIDCSDKLHVIRDVMNCIDVNEKNPITGRTPLHCACDVVLNPNNIQLQNKLVGEIVGLLLKSEADCCQDENLHVDAEGYDPLMLAARSGMTDAVRELVAHGARVGRVDPVSKKNALHLAAQSGEHFKLVNFRPMFEMLLAASSAEDKIAFNERSLPASDFK